MDRHKFTAKMREGALEVPFDVKAEWGAARPQIRMFIMGERHRTRIMVYGGKYYIGIWKHLQEDLALSEGDDVEVDIELDESVPKVDVPPELVAAIVKSVKLRTAWEDMSYTHRKEWARAVAEAKKPETKKKRVAAAIAALKARKPKKKPAKR